MYVQVLSFVWLQVLTSSLSNDGSKEFLLNNKVSEANLNALIYTKRILIDSHLWKGSILYNCTSLVLYFITDTIITIIYKHVSPLIDDLIDVKSKTEKTAFYY